MSKYIMSVDIGQSVDPSAIAVLEVTTRQEVVSRGDTVPMKWFRAKSDGGVIDPHGPAYIDVRHLERLPLRMPYPEQIEYVATLRRRAPLTLGTPLVLDQTGVGKPIVQQFERAGLHPIGVTITAGDGESQAGPRDFRVSKLVLVSRLQAMLHAGELRIAKSLLDAQTLVWELQDFRAQIGDSGYTRFGARSGTHDDLVLALAIGVWYASRPSNVPTVQVVQM